MNKKKHLLVIFTYDVSLKEWADTGLIGRELILYKKMVEEGYRVTLLTYGDEGDHDYPHFLQGIEVVPIYEYLKKGKNRWGRFFLSFFIPFKFRRLFKTADIIKTNQMSGSWVAVIGKFVYGKKLVVRCGFGMLRNMLRDEKRKFFRILILLWGYLIECVAYLMADWIIISNRSDERFIYKYYPVKPNKVSMIRNFIDTSLFRPSILHGITATLKNRVLFVGRLVECKNIQNLIEAVSIAQEGLDIVGSGHQEEYFRVTAKDLGADVNFLGVFPNSNLPDILIKYKIFILPSIYECSPKTLLEAMACERVVIGTNVEGIKELIVDGVSGFLCDTDAASIADALKKACCLTDDEALKMGRHARLFVENECTVQRVYDQECQIYNEVW